MNNGEKVDKAARERSEPADRSMRLRTLKLFKHVHSILGNIAFHALWDDMVFEWGAVKQFYFTSPAPPVMFATLGDEIAQLSQIKRPAKSPVEVMQLNDEEDAVRKKASSVVELCLE